MFYLSKNEKDSRYEQENIFQNCFYMYYIRNNSKKVVKKLSISFIQSYCCNTIDLTIKMFTWRFKHLEMTETSVIAHPQTLSLTTFPNSGARARVKIDDSVKITMFFFFNDVIANPDLVKIIQ